MMKFNWSDDTLSFVFLFGIIFQIVFQKQV